MKNNFNSQEIIKLLNNLIGLTEAQGDTTIDEQVEDNLKILIDVTNWCLDGLSYASESRYRYEASMNKIGNRAYGALLDYHKWIEDNFVKYKVTT